MVSGQNLQYMHSANALRLEFADNMDQANFMILHFVGPMTSNSTLQMIKNYLPSIRYLNKSQRFWDNWTNPDLPLKFFNKMIDGCKFLCKANVV